MNVQSLVVRALGRCGDTSQPPPFARRLVVILTGMALVSYGRGRSTVARLAGGFGAAMAARALAGCDDVARISAWFGASRGEPMPAARETRAALTQHEVDDTVEQSFPASDPPSWPASVAN
jgi:hypothetical protein